MRKQTEEMYEKPIAEVITLAIETSILEGSNEQIIPGQDF